MAQIIQHKRGSLEKLSSITGSLQKGEIVISTGSANLSNVTNGQGLVFATIESGSVVASNRILQGGTAPIFSASTYNGLMKGVPFYASSSKTLFLLGSDGNDAIDLTGNISTFSSSVDSRLDSIETSLGGGGSLGTRVGNLETISASYLAFTQSYYTDSASFDSRISASAASQTALSGAVATTISNLSSSVATSISSSAASINNTITALSTSVDSRLDAEEFKSTTFATTGSNTFVGTEVISGSLYITQNLVVYGSSSIQNVTASAVSIGTNTIVLNTANPGVRFGGIQVIDSGSSAATGSLLWDSQNNVWLYANPSGASYTSARLIAGPKNTGSIGNETGLTSGYITVAVGDDHIADSIMNQTTGKITLTGDLDVTGNISASTITGIGNVTTFSTSVDSRLDSVEASLGGGGSIGSRVTSLETISASYLSFTQSYYTDSASFDTRISSSKAEYTSFSASAATSFSASAASVTSLSASVASVNATQTTNITTAQNSADGAFASASAYSASAATSFSASAANVTALSASIATRDANQDSAVNTLSGSIYTQFSASAANVTSLSSSVASNLNTLSASIYQTDATQSTNITNNSSSFATSISASNFQISQLSASVASTTGDFSASIATQFSASAATVSGLSASVATSFSASAASQLNLSASVYQTDATQSNQIGILNDHLAAFDQAIELTGSQVTIVGNLVVKGTTTSIESTTVNIGDNIIELNGTGATNGGLYIKDPTSPNAGTGSLVWDTTNDYWKAGFKFSESKVLLATGDNVVSASAQITLGSTTGFTAFDTAISTSFSASNANIASLSASVASVTGNFSSSVATSFSASNAAVTALSTSVDSRLDTLEGSGTIQGVGTTNKVTFAAVTASINIPSGGGNSKRLAFRGTTDTIEFIAAPTTVGDIAQWDGSDFIMSNVIDGGSF